MTELNNNKEATSEQKTHLVNKNSLVSKLGWVVAIICIIGLFLTFRDFNSLKKNVVKQKIEIVTLEEQVQELSTAIISLNELLHTTTKEGYKRFTLSGNQAVAPDAQATIYIANDLKTTLFDISEMPEPPSGMVYQAWGLTMEPFEFTSMGVLSTKSNTSQKIYSFNTVPNNEAIGITLEKKEGVSQPSVSKLYVLGKVSLEL